jgi:flagellar basal body-associated protein FliL
VAEAADDKVEVEVKKPPMLLIILSTLVIFLIAVIISMSVSIRTAEIVAKKTVKSQDMVFEEEKNAIAVVPLASSAKDGSYMVYIKKGAEQNNLSLQLQLSAGVTTAELGAILTDKEKVAPIVDRLLAYFSEKTKADIVYAFQKKILGEELKEIMNAILEREMKLKEEQGRIASVHITRLLFMPV